MKKILIIKSILTILFKVFNAKVAGKKTVIFHHPNKKLTHNTDYYIRKLFNKFKHDHLIIYTHESESLSKNNYFFISQWYLKFIVGIDFFVSTYVCDKFTLNSKKIYIHHDIYDTPISGDKKKRNIIFKIQKYDFIFVSSNLTKKMFDNFFRKKSIIKKPVTIITGYLKLDYLLKRKIKKNIRPNKIIIAPTNIHAFGESKLIKDLYILINKLLKLNFEIVLRPHPSNIKDKKFNQIKKRFRNKKKFSFNTDKNYLSIYAKSVYMITDISGTAYTFAFMTNRPVIFYNYQNEFNFDKNLFFFKDRNKVGKICYNSKQLIDFIKDNKNFQKFNSTILKLKQNRLNNLGNVDNYIYNFFKKF